MIDRRTLLLAAGAVPVAACVRPKPAARAEVRVATFNIWHDAGDWPSRLPLLVAALRSADADIIALQEVLEDAGKRLPNQAGTIATMLGGYTCHFASVDPEGAPRRYGNALLSRLPVQAVDRRALAPRRDYRTAIRARVGVGGRVIDVVCTHLASQPEAGAVRAEQVADLIGWLPADGVPAVLMGDFNAALGDEGLAALAARFDHAALPATIASTLNPAKGHRPRIIDHVFVDRPTLAVRDADIIGDRPVDGRHASDHFGVRATVGFRRI